MIIHVPNLFVCKSIIYTALNCTLQTILIQFYIIYVYVFFSKNNCLSAFFFVCFGRGKRRELRIFLQTKSVPTETLGDRGLGG